jgi:hypothetical protein
MVGLLSYEKVHETSSLEPLLLMCYPILSMMLQSSEGNKSLFHFGAYVGMLASIIVVFEILLVSETIGDLIFHSKVVS